jgi:excisionase family DNA binding protein
MSKISITEACKLAQISRPTLYKQINSGVISTVKDGKKVFIETSELLRVYPDVVLNGVNESENTLHTFTNDLQQKDEVISLLKQQLNDRQKENDFLKEQLTQVNNNFTLLNNILQNKQEEKPQKTKKFFGLF